MQFFFRISNNNLVFIIKYNFIFILELTFQRSDIEFLDIEGVPELPAICTPGRTKGRKRVISSSQYTCARARTYTYTQRERKVLHGRAGVIDLIPRENWRRGNRLGKGLSIRRFRHLSLCSSVSRLGREKKKILLFFHLVAMRIYRTHILFSYRGKERQLSLELYNFSIFLRNKYSREFFFLLYLIFK